MEIDKIAEVIQRHVDKGVDFKEVNFNQEKQQVQVQADTIFNVRTMRMVENNICSAQSFYAEDFDKFKQEFEEWVETIVEEAEKEAKEEFLECSKKWYKLQQVKDNLESDN